MEHVDQLRRAIKACTLITQCPLCYCDTVAGEPHPVCIKIQAYKYKHDKRYKRKKSASI